MKSNHSVIKFYYILFILSILSFSFCYFDSKTSVQSEYQEIKYTCDKVYGLGNSTAFVLSQNKYENFWELKEKYKWIDVKKVSTHFKMGRDIMRFEIFCNVVGVTGVACLLSVTLIAFYWLGKLYQHKLTFDSLSRMVLGKSKGEKNGK